MLVVTWVLAELLLDGDVHLVEQTLVALLLVFPVLFLVTRLVAVLENDISIELEVEHQLVHVVLSLESTVLERILGQVVRGQGVVRI